MKSACLPVTMYISDFLPGWSLKEFFLFPFQFPELSAFEHAIHIAAHIELPVLIPDNHGCNEYAVLRLFMVAFLTINLSILYH